MTDEIRQELIRAGEEWVERGGRAWLVLEPQGRVRLLRSYPLLLFLLLRGAHAVELPSDRMGEAEISAFESIPDWRRAYLYEAAIPHLESALEDGESDQQG